jgi:hypothetical protein
MMVTPFQSTGCYISLVAKDKTTDVALQLIYKHDSIAVSSERISDKADSSEVGQTFQIRFSDNRPMDLSSFSPSFVQSLSHGEKAILEATRQLWNQNDVCRNAPTS